MNVIGEVLGEVCKIVLPIPQESYRGNPESPVAVCTLSDIKLLERLASSDVLPHVNIIGRLLSENKGIDVILKFLHDNVHVHTLIVCGSDVQGHRAGHSLLCLHKYGVYTDRSNNYRIANKILHSHSPDPYLSATPTQIRHFCQDVSVVDMVGISDYIKITKRVMNCSY